MKEVTAMPGAGSLLLAWKVVLSTRDTNISFELFLICKRIRSAHFESN